MKWHLSEIDAALQELNSDPQQGLSNSDAAGRLERYGLNELAETGQRPPQQILAEQLAGPGVLLLAAGAVVLAGFARDVRSAVAVAAAALLNVLLGFIQDYHGEKKVAALRRMSVPDVRVVRDGVTRTISARGLVPGDILQLEQGTVVPADVRLLEAVNLRVQEAVLTGEAEPVGKHTAMLAGDDLPLGDRRNMAYMGTSITQGRALALVVATGMQTELGRIAELIQQTAPGRAPLRRRLDRWGWRLALGGFAALVASLLFGWRIRHEAPAALLELASSFAVALVPAGLLAVVTAALALEAHRMLARNTLVRRLSAVGTLGDVTVICSDKTGTLTENRMTVMALDVVEHQLDLTQEVRKGGMVLLAGNPSVEAAGSLSLMAIGAALCNDARLMDEGDDRFHTLGDPTEGALVVAAARMGYWKSSLDLAFPRAAELPFDPDRKRMTTVHHLRDYRPETLAGLDVGSHRYIAFTKGRVDSLLELSSRVWAEGRPARMSGAWRARIKSSYEGLIQKGVRVTAVAFRLLNKVPEILQTDLEDNLTFVGLFGMVDPPRADVRDAVALARGLGVRSVMITGDHPVNALEIARELGISRPFGLVPGVKGGRDGADARSDVLTGPEIDRMSDAELKKIIDEVRVFARVSSEDKLRIVRVLQELGHVVALTGEGLNDAPALRRADVGVAMGVTGTEVSKEASDLVLLDDNFATIVSAVQAGRRVRAAIEGFISFSASGIIARALVLLCLPLLGGLPLAITPLQLLWLSLVIDGLLGFGLVVGVREEGPVSQTPPGPVCGILVGISAGLLALGLAMGLRSAAQPAPQTLIFTGLAFIQIGQALALSVGGDAGPRARSLRFGIPIVALILQMLVLYVSPLQAYFGLQALPASSIALTLAAGAVMFVGIVLGKRLPGN